MRTVDWVTAKPEGLRERKKRQTRQLLTDTATEMFLDRGFDAVRVAEIAEACGVSEKTVFNYFPTKESLVVDHPAAALDALRAGLADVTVSPVEAVTRILAGELAAMTTWLAAQDDTAVAVARFQRYGELIQSTPTLRAYQRDMRDELVTVAAEAVAVRVGMRADAPEPQIAATALVGLWRIQFTALRKHLTDTRSPAQVKRSVTTEVRRAARLIDEGLAALSGRTT